MLSSERVKAVINHRKPDRIPVYSWASANMGDKITPHFGSVANFEDQYEFDFAHIFGGPPNYEEKALGDLRDACDGTIEPKDLLGLPLADPDVMEHYDGIRERIDHHKTQRGRFVYVQTPGLFECLNGVFGIENHLTYLALFPDDLHKVYARQAEWNRSFANNCIDCGVDMIHVSDDWGAQTGLMFNPKLWWEMMYPYHRVVCDAAERRNTFVSIHSDGNNNSVLDGIVKLGFDVMHPFQESAGMDLADFKANYRDKFTVMGGLDVQTTIGFGKMEFLEAEIRRVLGMFVDGGLLYCTTHFIQNHCSIEELIFAYDLIYDLVRKPDA